MSMSKITGNFLFPSTALTNFSPSLLALNDSLLTQLQHARESVQNSLRLHRSLVGSIENDFEYTTLENTKEVRSDVIHKLVLYSDCLS